MATPLPTKWLSPGSRRRQSLDARPPAGGPRSLPQQSRNACQRHFCGGWGESVPRPLGHPLPHLTRFPWGSRDGQRRANSASQAWVNQRFSLLLPPSPRPLLPHSAPGPPSGLCHRPVDPRRGPAAALLCHLLSHPAAHPLHVHQPLPGHLHHVHHLPQCGHHVPGALQPACGEPQPHPSPGSHGGGAWEDPTLGTGRGRI